MKLPLTAIILFSSIFLSACNLQRGQYGLAEILLVRLFGTTDAIVAASAVTTPTPAPTIEVTYPSSSYTFIVGTAITTITPTASQTITSCSISPSLPASLNFSSTSCEISGTPTIMQTAKTYAVTANNSTTANASISITIAASTNTPQYITEWNSGGAGSFNQARCVAIDKYDNIYVCDGVNNRIQKFDSNMNYILSWTTTGEPWGIAIDSNDFIYIALQSSSLIQKYSLTGTQIGSNWTGFNGPRAVAVDASNNIYVTDSDNNQIQKFDSNGNFLIQWGSAGAGNSQFNFPNGIKIDASNNIIVADWLNCRIQKFDSNGNFLLQWGSNGSANGQFDSSWGVGIDMFGEIYVSEVIGNNRIQKFKSDGTFILKWGSSGAGNSQFNDPEAIAFDSKGYIYIADMTNSRIQKFSPF